MPEDIIENVRSRNDIVQVLAEYISLKKIGRSYKSLCPFHNEKTPSFIVSPEKQIFHCFGCGEGGNVFTFVMKMEGLTFPEALKKLAAKVGVTLPELPKSAEFGRQSKERETLVKLNEQVADYYHRYLLEAKDGVRAREYLKKRNISPAIIKKFKIGYAAKGNNLLDLAKKKGYSPELLKKGGLISFYSDSNRYYDYFQERIIFPIYNPPGQVIAFGGRVLSDDKKPKYLNSPETILYNKSRNLYGLNIAAGAIRTGNKALILEGYIDVLTTHQYGIENAVATLGTALTPEHIQLLKRYAEEVVITYDTDAPGISATLRGLDLLLDTGLRVKVVSLPSGKDPDEFLQAKGTEAFIEVLNKALPLVDYRLNIAAAKVDIRSTEGKIYVAKDVLPTIARLKNAIEQREELKKISQRLSLDEESLLIELEKIKTRTPGEAGLENMVVQDSLGVEKAQRELLQLMLTEPGVIEKIKDEIGPADFSVLDLAVIAEEIFKLSPYAGEDLAAKIIDSLENEKLSQLISRLILEDKKYSEIDRTTRGLIKNIKEHSMRQRYARLEEEVKNMLDRNEQPPQETLREYKELIQALKGSRRN
ncbi:MAG: DNA primase [bacterium]